MRACEWDCSGGGELGGWTEASAGKGYGGVRRQGSGDDGMEIRFNPGA